jgi:hypothetical protein
LGTNLETVVMARFRPAVFLRFEKLDESRVSRKRQKYDEEIPFVRVRPYRSIVNKEIVSE